MISVLTPAGTPGLPPGFTRYFRQSKLYQRLAQPGGGWTTESIAYGQTPAVVSGDVGVVDPLWVPGNYANVFGADAVASYDGDGDTSRQSIIADIYSYRSRAYYGAAPFANNNASPSFSGSFVLVLDEDVPMVSYNLAAYFPDAEGDVIEVTALDGPGGSPVNIATLIPGLSITNGIVSGTPTTRALTNLNIRGSDPYGASANGFVDVVVGLVDVPNVVGLSVDDADSVLTSVYLTSSVVPFDTGGAVLFQSPAAGADVAAFSTVILYTRIAVPDLIGQTQAAAQSALTTLGLTYTIAYRRTANFVEGTIADQDPAADEYLDAGNSVTLYVARPYPISLVKTIRRKTVN